MALQDDWVRLTLRIPPDLHNRIQASATQNGQPINSEINDTLSKGYPSVSPMADLFNQIWTLIESITENTDGETRNKIGNVLVSFISVAAKENPSLKDLAERAIRERAARSLTGAKP